MARPLHRPPCYLLANFSDRRSLHVETLRPSVPLGLEPQDGKALRVELKDLLPLCLRLQNDGGSLLGHSASLFSFHHHLHTR